MRETRRGLTEHWPSGRVGKGKAGEGGRASSELDASDRSCPESRRWRGSAGPHRARGTGDVGGVKAGIPLSLRGYTELD